MLMQDAPDILLRVISSAVTEEDTLCHAFHTNIQPVENMANDTDNMNEQNEIIVGVGDMDFDHDLT
jgi:hypothetical protein